jgi:hypothetical protein
VRATLVKGLALTTVKVSVAVSASGSPIVTVGAILSVTNPVALAWFWGHFRSVSGGDGSLGWLWPSQSERSANFEAWSWKGTHSGQFFRLEWIGLVDCSLSPAHL